LRHAGFGPLLRSYRPDRPDGGTRSDLNMGRGNRKRRRVNAVGRKGRPWPKWVEIILIPAVVALVVGIVVALYQADVTLDQAGEQEASAQKGAEQAEDRELAQEPAVRARVQPLQDTHWVCVFPEPVDEAVLRKGGLSASEEERTRLFSEHGGLMGNAVPMWMRNELKPTWTYQVSLIGNRREPVRVLDIRARILDRSAPLDGAVVWFPPQGEGDVREVLVDLDDPEGVLLLPPEPGSDAPPKPFFDVKYLTLQRNEEVVLGLTALATRHHYRWELELTVAYGDVPGETVRVRSDGTPDGHPFEATGWSEQGTYRGGVFTVTFHYPNPQPIVVRTR
jgi:hypothetical protein